MKLLERLLKMLIRKKDAEKIDTRFEEQRLWFINNIPRSIKSKADEDYCAEFIDEISEHFNPIELENFPLRLSITESTVLGKQLADLMKEYACYKKRNAKILKDFFEKVNGKLSMQTIQEITIYLKNEEEFSQNLFFMYNKLAHLLLIGSEINKSKENKHAKK